MELEYIGPIDGYKKGKHFISIWTEIAGLHQKDKDGFFRYENAENLYENGPAYLFWQKDNKKDKNAVAIFSDRECALHVGYIPIDYSKDCIEAYKKGYIRIGVVIKRITYKQKRNKWGDYEDTETIDSIKILLEEYYNEEIAKETDIYQYLNICKNIPKNVLDALSAASMLNYEKLLKCSDKEILGLPGVGKTTLKKLREACPTMEYLPKFKQTYLHQSEDNLSDYPTELRIPNDGCSFKVDAKIPRRKRKA